MNKIINTITIILLLAFPLMAQEKGENKDIYEVSYVLHTVQKDQTLWRIASIHYKKGNLSEIIANFNDIKDVTDIEIGTDLKIPQLEFYRVQKDDTLESISEKFFKSKDNVEYITRFNKISGSGTLKIGQKLNIPVLVRKKVAEVEEAEKEEEATEILKDLKKKEEKQKNEIKVDKVESEQETLSEIPEEEKIEEPDVSIKEEVKPDIDTRIIKQESEKDKPQIKDLETVKTEVKSENTITEPEIKGAQKEVDIETEPEIKQENIENTEEPELGIVKNPKPIGKDVKNIISEMPKGKTLAQQRIEGYLKESEIAPTLAEHGFENVSVASEGDFISITYENRIYRHETKAIEEVLNISAPFIDKQKNILIIPQNRGIPLVSVIKSTVSPPLYTIASKNKSNSPGFTASIETHTESMKKYGNPKLNSPAFMLDITIEPQFKAHFGSHRESIATQFNLAPTADLNLWKGMSILGQMIIPIQNEFGEEDDYWRPGILAANQILRLPFKTFVSTTAGYFTENRYGIDMEIRKYFFNGSLYLGADGGYTGYASYFKGNWQWEDVDLLTGTANAGFRLSPFDLVLTAKYGKYLEADTGWRFEMLRQFGELDLGFFAIKTDIGFNGGFTISIPLFPPRYIPTGPIRFGPSKNFSWEYRYRRTTKEAIEYKTGNSIDNFIEHLNPAYVENQLKDYQ
ncbi:LysM peptidoglycan-binding domain-containing protein [Candidatus Poribacteria bacterium]|nr:LysM peptidoglycan-binding domain-containing protein [Candidatus Poribacteria bacterium]